jgi:hypothetical protein
MDDNNNDNNNDKKQQQKLEPEYWVIWDDFLRYDPDRPKAEIIRILKSIIIEIEQWRDKPTRLYTLLSANKMLNLPYSNPYRKFMKGIVKTAEGLQQIKDFIKSEKNQDNDNDDNDTKEPSYKDVKKSNQDYDDDGDSIHVQTEQDIS